MSLSSSVSILATSLRNFQSAVQVHSNNAANSETVGFSRRRANFAEIVPFSTDRFATGSGSELSSISRLRDVFLDNQIRAQLTQVGYHEALSTSLELLSFYFPDIANPSAAGGISNLIDGFYDAWAALGAAPGSNAQKQAVISQGAALANTLRTTMQGLSTLRTDLNKEIESTITEINSLLSQIADLNGRIKSNPGAKNALLDAREKAMQDLARLADVIFRDTDDGSVAVLFAKGTMVSGTQVFGFKAIKGLPDANLFKVGYPSNSPTPADVTAFIRGGKLGGLLKARDGAVEDAIFAVQAIGTGLIENSNLIYHSAEDSSGAHADFFSGNNSGDIRVNTVLTSSTTGSALLSEFLPSGAAGGLAKAMASARNAFTATYVRSQAAISAAFSGNAPINTQPAPIPTPFSVTGRVHIDLSSGGAAAVDWNNGQSLSQIADNITTALAGAGVAAYDETSRRFTILSSQPISLYDETGNLARVLRLRAFLNSSTNINANIDPSVNSITGNEALGSGGLAGGLIHYFKQATAAGNYSVNNTPVVWADTQDANTITGNIIGSTGFQIIAFFDPASQRVIQFKNNNNPTVGNPLTSFTGADALGNFAALAAIKAPSNLSNTYAGLISGAFTDASLEQAQKDAAEQVLGDLQAVQDNVSKVNKDEELAQAIEFQRAYEASIRVISVIDQMLNVLVNHVGSQSSAVNTGSIEV